MEQEGLTVCWQCLSRGCLDVERCRRFGITLWRVHCTFPHCTSKVTALSRDGAIRRWNRVSARRWQWEWTPERCVLWKEK